MPSSSRLEISSRHMDAQSTSVAKIQIRSSRLLWLKCMHPFLNALVEAPCRTSCRKLFCRKGLLEGTRKASAPNAHPIWLTCRLSLLTALARRAWW
eukprot:s19_g6.t1